jgi:hypothetical protein
MPIGMYREPDTGCDFLKKGLSVLNSWLHVIPALRAVNWLGSAAYGGSSVRFTAQAPAEYGAFRFGADSA